ncbi:MAG: cytochrome c [Saprospiraceae bacterium]|nr:cytochrome c [Saprospiraceae bacterium]
MFKVSSFALIGAAVLTLFFSCKKDEIQTYDCTGITPTYTADIKAVMNASCATSGCHNATSKAKGIDLSTYAKVKSESANDRFMGSMQHLSGYDNMPQGASKLSDETLQKIYCWIHNGQPE